MSLSSKTFFASHRRDGSRSARRPSAVLVASLLASMPAWAQPTSTTLHIPSFSEFPLAAAMASLLFVIVIIMMLYAVRHFIFTMNRLVGVQRHPYIDIAVAGWPMITVFIAAHNEEKVIAGCIEALLNTDYPADRLKIIPVNDRSKDSTGVIIDSYVARFPSRISPFHRTSGKAGKGAALKDALNFAAPTC